MGEEAPRGRRETERMSGRVDVALVENLLLVSDGFRKKYSGQIDVKEMDVSVHDLVVFQIRHKQASYGIVITHLWPLALPRRAHLRNDYDDIRGAIETAIKRKP